MSDKTEKYIMETLGRVEGSMKDGFERIERRMDNFVTRDALDATTKGLSARDDQLEKQITESASRTRWVIGLLVPTAGILSGIIFGIVNALP